MVGPRILSGIETRSGQPGAEGRKQRSERELSGMGVPVNLHLPVISDGEADFIRPPQSVAKRCLVLLALLNVARGNKREEILDWMRRYGLWEEASPVERAFFGTPGPDENTVMESTWRAEALHVLLWALGLVPGAGPPSRLCSLDDPELFLRIPGPGSDPRPFIEEAELRGDDELLDELDMTYRLHWAVREAELSGSTVPCGLIPGVVHERHYALNWLVGTVGWDDVSTDT